MWKGMDRAGIEAALGRGVRWVEEEDKSDVTFLADKAASVELTHKEQLQYDALIALYISGR